LALRQFAGFATDVSQESDMKCRRSLFLASFMIFLALPACRQQSQQDSEARIPTVTVAEPMIQKVFDKKFYNVSRIDPFQSVDIRAQVSGYLDSINFKPGDDVKKDDLLFVIDPRPYQAAYDEAKSNVAALQAKLQRATNDMDRADRLISTKAISQEDYDRAAATKLEAAAGLQGAQAALEKADLNLKFTHITAPIDGRISRNMIDVGNLVQANAADSKVLTNIVDTSKIYAYFDMEETVVFQLIRKHIAESSKEKVDRKYFDENDPSKSNKDFSYIPVWMKVSNDTDFKYTGHVDFIDNRVVADTGTMNIRAIFDNPKMNGDVRALVAGAHGDVCIPISEEYEALLVPDEAIQFDQDRILLYVVNDKNVVVAKPVTRGELENGLRVIRSGIAAKDRVIVNGFIRVRPGMTVKPIMEQPKQEPKTIEKKEQSGGEKK
jgi:RND family efflux transporter MFP subunit